MKCDIITAPRHYMEASIQPIEITKNYGFILGSAIKYILRAPYKDSYFDDTRKAIHYITMAMGHPEFWAPVATDEAFTTAVAAFRARNKFLKALLNADGETSEPYLLAAQQMLEKELDTFAADEILEDLPLDYPESKTWLSRQTVTNESAADGALPFQSRADKEA